jgi:hypothetical protein
MPAEMIGPIEVALLVAKALERVGAQYFLGGSLASSVQGEPRATNDVDFVVDLSTAQVEPFARELGADFEVDAPSLLEAVQRRGSWNIFHLPSMTKVDLFLKQTGPFDDSEFSRRRLLKLAPDQELIVKSPEDTVLRKLIWFEQGGRASTTQWRDIVEVLRVSGPVLDSSYLESWAVRLGLPELLAQAWIDARKDQ